MCRCRLFMIWMIVFSSCQNAVLKINDYTCISETVNKGYEHKKPLLFYLTLPDCMPCELIDYKILKDEAVVNYVNNHFLFYHLDISEGCRLFNKLFCFYGAPFMVIVEDGKIKSVVSNINESRHLLLALENYKMMDLAMTCSTVTTLRGKEQHIANMINELFEYFYKEETKEWKNQEKIAFLERSVSEYPCFYNKLLLTNSYHGVDSVKANLLAEELVEQITPLYMLLYGAEIQQMMNAYYHLTDDMKSKIEFVNNKYDFGTVPPNSTHSCSFVFKNESPVPLLIYTVRAGCGCLVTDWPHRPILTGMTDTIKAEFRAGTTGKISKTINVITNSAKRNTVLTVSAIVE